MKEFVDVLLLIAAQFFETVLDSRQSVHGGQYYTTALTQLLNSDSSQQCNLFQQPVLHRTSNIYTDSLLSCGICNCIVTNAECTL